MLWPLNRAHCTDCVLCRSPRVSSSPSPTSLYRHAEGHVHPLPCRSLLSRAEAHESCRLGVHSVEVCGQKRMVTQGTSSS